MSKPYLCFALICSFIFINEFDNANADTDLKKIWEEHKLGPIDWEAVYTADYFVNTRGGTKRDSAYLDNVDLLFSTSSDKLNLWEGGNIFLYILGNGGTKKFSADILGDLQTASNIEAPRSWRVYEFWYEHTTEDGKWSLLSGIHDYNSEFNVADYGQLFINSSFGIQPDVAQNARPSIFSLTAPGLRLKQKINETTTWLLGIYDGQPDDANEVAHFPRFDFDSEGGALFVNELDIALHASSITDKLKLGLWHNTGKFDHLTNTDNNGDPEQKYYNYGGYMILDKTIFEKNDSEKLGFFAQVGGTKSDVNLINLYWGAGLNWQGFSSQRPDDALGLAVAHASISNKLSDTGVNDNHETTLELTYKAVFNDNFSIQPDIQWIFNPGADPNLKNAVAMGIRCEIAL